MQMIVRYGTGRMEDCVLLAANHDVMRIVVRRRNETMELRRNGTDWVSENGDSLQIESVIAIGEAFFSGAGVQPALSSAA